MPKVSVIIPVFKAEKYIEECARSLFEQTIDDIEYIFVDDCTPDKSMEIMRNVLEEYPVRKPQVKIIVMPKNSGQAVATRIAIKQATGDYIIRCDSDDYVDRNAYQVMVDASEDGKYDILACDKYLFGNGSGKISKTFRHPRDASREQMIANLLTVYGYPSLCSSLVKRNLYESPIIFPEAKMGEDRALLLQLLFYCKSLRYINKALYFYRFNPESTCHNTNKEAVIDRFKDLRTNVDFMVEFLAEKGLSEIYSRQIEVAKESVRTKLFPILKTPEMIDKWASVYPEVYWKILFNPYVSLVHKKAVISKIIRRICRI